MNFTLTWHKSNDPHKLDHHYLRANEITVGSVSYFVMMKQDVERPYSVSSYLPHGKPFINRFSTLEDAQGAMVIAARKWFKHFGVE